MAGWYNKVHMSENLGLGAIVAVLISLLISMTIHEAMHAFTGYWLGDDTARLHGRLSLNPLKHIDPFTTILLPIVTYVVFGVPLLAARPVPFNPNRVRYGEFGAALVGLAGPFTNLLLALSGAGIVHLVAGVAPTAVLQGIVIFVQINVALFVFNMIPIPPLDGSRALYAVAPEPVQEFMASLERYGVLLIFGLVLLIPAFGTLLISLNTSILRLLLGQI